MSTLVLVDKNGVAVPLEVDEHNNLGVVNVDYVHEKVHDGEVFSFNYFDSDVDSGETMRLKIVTGSKYFHFVFEAQFEAKAIFRSRSGGTYGAGTAPDDVKLTKFARKTDSTKTIETVVTYEPTVTTAGIVRGFRPILGGTGNSRVGSSIGPTRIESLIAPNTTIILEIENTSGTNNNYGCIVIDECYETTAAEL
jgi:hypothetical protein